MVEAKNPYYDQHTTLDPILPLILTTNVEDLLGGIRKEYFECRIDCVAYDDAHNPAVQTLLFYTLKHDNRLNNQYYLAELELVDNTPQSARAFGLDIQNIMKLVNYKQADNWNDVKNKVNDIKIMLDQLGEALRADLRDSKFTKEIIMKKLYLIILCGSLSFWLPQIASAHASILNNEARLVCENSMRSDSCEYTNNHEDIYRGTCQMMSDKLLCVRNQPIEKAAFRFHT